MQTKLIQIKDYLLLIDEEAEIKENLWSKIPVGGYFYSKIREEVVELQPRERNYDPSGFEIIAYYPLTKEAKELDLPLLPNPFDTYKMFEIVDGTCEKGGYEHWLFDQGYMAAQSKQFSLEDMKKAIEMATHINPSDTNRFYSSEEIIQSLSTQQLPKEFIPDYEVVYFHGNGYYNESELSIEVREKYNFMKESKLKTITNSKGKQEIQGTYKY